MGREEIIKKLKKFKIKMERIHSIDKMILFGSQASGKATKDSDVDIVIVSKDFRRKSVFKRPQNFYTQWEYGLPVDFICYTPEEFEKKKKGITIVTEALKKGIEI